MLVALVLLLGMGNFAFHTAVLDSRHPLLGEGSAQGGRRLGVVTLPIEFLMLVAAALLTANGWPGLAWAYAMYTALNALSAWLIVTRRI